jgi:hypothetical protein
MIQYIAELALWMAIPFLVGCLAGAVLRLTLRAQARVKDQAGPGSGR